MSKTWQTSHNSCVKLSPENSGLIWIQIGADTYSLTIHNMYDIICRSIEVINLRKKPPVVSEINL